MSKRTNPEVWGDDGPLDDDDLDAEEKMGEEEIEKKDLGEETDEFEDE